MDNPPQESPAAVFVWLRLMLCDLEGESPLLAGATRVAESFGIHRRFIKKGLDDLVTAGWLVTQRLAGGRGRPEIAYKYGCQHVWRSAAAWLRRRDLWRLLSAVLLNQISENGYDTDPGSDEGSGPRPFRLSVANRLVLATLLSRANSHGFVAGFSRRVLAQSAGLSLTGWARQVRYLISLGYVRCWLSSGAFKGKRAEGPELLVLNLEHPGFSECAVEPSLIAILPPSPVGAGVKWPAGGGRQLLKVAESWSASPGGDVSGLWRLGDGTDPLAESVYVAFTMDAGSGMEAFCRTRHLIRHDAYFEWFMDYMAVLAAGSRHSGREGQVALRIMSESRRYLLSSGEMPPTDMDLDVAIDFLWSISMERGELFRREVLELGLPDPRLASYIPFPRGRMSGGEAAVFRCLNPEKSGPDFKGVRTILGRRNKGGYPLKPPVARDGLSAAEQRELGILRRQAK